MNGNHHLPYYFGEHCIFMSNRLCLLYLTSPHLQYQGISLPVFPAQFSFFFLLLVSCFYTLRPLQIILLTSSWGAGRREIRMYKGLLPIVRHVIVFPNLGNFKEAHNCTPSVKWGVVSLKALKGIFHSSPWSLPIWSSKKLVSLYMPCIPIRG